MTHTNYTVAPGEYLQEWADEHQLPHHALASLLRYSQHTLHTITTGSQPITDEIAARLEHTTGIPTQAWLRYEQAYRADLERLAQE